MNEYLHPVSAIPMRGMRLAPGATLRKDDLYDSTDGKWRPCPCTGATICDGCTTFFIRPGVGLSPEAEKLLAHLAKWNLYLTWRHWWIAIPSLRWKNDGRMDWQITHPECIQELVDDGFVRPHPDDEEVYRLTKSGRLAGRTSVQ